MVGANRLIVLDTNPLRPENWKWSEVIKIVKIRGGEGRSSIGDQKPKDWADVAHLWGLGGEPRRF